MEVIKDIAAIIGVILSAASLITLLSKTVRTAIANMFKKYSHDDEVTQKINEIKTMLETHIREEQECKNNCMEANAISMEFIKTQCRNIIKTIFYRYNDTKVLPLYEKKTLLNVEDLYVRRLGGNSFAALLIEEMSHWDIDYGDMHPSEEDEN